MTGPPRPGYCSNNADPVLQQVFLSCDDPFHVVDCLKVLGGVQCIAPTPAACFCEEPKPRFFVSIICKVWQ